MSGASIQAIVKIYVACWFHDYEACLKLQECGLSRFFETSGDAMYVARHCQIVERYANDRGLAW